MNVISGKVTVGTSPDVDIILQGTGVQPKHCVIENVGNVVTLYPLANMTTIDGLRVTSPTRLCQGNMLCIGRSNYLRFNHPAEANLMKKFLPNTRISMAAPLNFFGNGDAFYEKKPPVPPSRRSRDSWGELSNGSNEETPTTSNKPSKLEILSQSPNKNSISPKVFPPGSATVNSPASVVLGHSRIPNGLLAGTENASKNSSLLSSSESGNMDYIEPAVPQVISSYPQKATMSTFSQQQNYSPNGFSFVEMEGFQNGSKTTSPKVLSLPSPAFNRNPSPYVSDKFRSITPNMFLGRSPSPSGNPRSMSPIDISNSSEEISMKLMSRSHDSRLSPNFNFSVNQEDFNNKKMNLESKMFQVSFKNVS